MVSNASPPHTSPRTSRARNREARLKFLAPLLPSAARSSYDNSGAYWPWLTQFTTGGNTYTVPVQTTLPGQKAERIANNFAGYVTGGLYSNGVVFGLEAQRVRVFSQARLQFQRFNNGRPGDLFGTPALGLLEHPWPGGTSADLMAWSLLYADFGGNSYAANIDGQVVMMRPDWVDIILGDRYYRGGIVGRERVGYSYTFGGMNSGNEPVFFLADEVCHFAPMPDPLANYRGMSWLTPVVREIQSDTAFTSHKLKFTENAATPNLAVSLKEVTDPTQFQDFVDKMDDSHRGWENAYKTLYLGAGADVTVIGTDLRSLDFKAVQGAGETRLAAAAGVPAVVAGLSESLGGSSLNSGNYGQARRQFADTTLAHLWANFAASMERLVTPPAGTRLWTDGRDIPFLREDQKDAAEIQSTKTTAIANLITAGFEPSSVIAAVSADDLTLLRHTGLFSIQLQEAGSPQIPAAESAA